MCNLLFPIDDLNYIEMKLEMRFELSICFTNFCNRLQAHISIKNQVDKMISLDRAGLVFVFNFHPTKSFTDYRIGVPVSGTYRIVLDTDERRFGGYEQIDHHTDYISSEEECGGRSHSILVNDSRYES